MKDSEKQLYNAFSADTEIPERLDARLTYSYAVIRRQEGKGISMQKRNNYKGIRTAVLIAAAVCVLAGAAFAVASHSEFFNSAYGNNIPSEAAKTIEITDESGKVVKTESYPAKERVAVDEEMAEELIGEYVSAVGESVTLNGYTFTVQDYVLDENGIGAVTVDVDNPEGLNIQNSYDAYAGEFSPFYMVFAWEDGSESGYSCFDDRHFIDETVTTDTHVRYVYYLVAGYNADADITLRVNIWDGTFEAVESPNGQVFPNYSETTLTIPRASYVSTKTFSCEGLTAELSPVGCVLDYGFEEFTDVVHDEFILRFADGSEYVVRDEDMSNLTVGLWREDHTEGIAFNRLVDVENVTEIILNAYTLDDNNQRTELNFTAVP